MFFLIMKEGESHEYKRDFKGFCGGLRDSRAASDYAKHCVALLLCLTKWLATRPHVVPQTTCFIDHSTFLFSSVVKRPAPIPILIPIPMGCYKDILLL